MFRLPNGTTVELATVAIAGDRVEAIVVVVWPDGRRSDGSVTIGRDESTQYDNPPTEG